MVEILAEAAHPQRLREVFVCRGDDPHVDGLGAGAAEAADDSVLEDLEQLRLQGRREHPDLVEEQRPAMRQLKETRLGLVGARESAALVAEQLRFEEGLWNRRAVDVDERRAGAGPRPVHGPRDEALARAGLAAQEDRRGTRRRRRTLEDLFELLPQPPDAGAVAGDLGQGVHGGILSHYRS
jgi:hypothetical protein